MKHKIYFDLKSLTEKREYYCRVFVSDQYFQTMAELFNRGRRYRRRIVVGFTTTYAISAYHH